MYQQSGIYGRKPISRCVLRNGSTRNVGQLDVKTLIRRPKMIALVEENRMNLDSIGSEVELRVSGMPIALENHGSTV